MNNLVLSNFVMPKKPIGNGKGQHFPFIHLFSISINSLLPYHAGNCGSVMPVQAEIWWEAGYTVYKSQLNYRADMQYSDRQLLTLTATHKFKSLINLMCLSITVGRAQEPRKNSRERRLSNRGNKLVGFLL